jgi:aminomethyltransferase
MQSRGQVARQLVGIRMNDDALPMAGTKVLDGEGNEIGGITSSTISPVLSGAAICLGYVKRASAATGTVLRVPAEGAIHEGKVVELPFLR